MRDPPIVVVLGDEALQRLNPSVIARYLRRPGCVSLGSARVCPAHIVADWARRCPVQFVPEGELSRRIATARGLGSAILADAEPSSDPCDRRERMRKALLVLQRSRDYQVKTWAADLGTDRHALKRLCAATLGVTPEEIAWVFFDARVHREILHGRSDAEVAASVGLANAYALRRAYLLRGLPYPRG
jgi:AraC-like DNA-binding protein